jgi:hypothetical protein
MITSMHASLIAIGRQLQAEYLPAIGKPLPSELEGLLARLVALEAGRRESIESVEALPAAVAWPRGRP